MQAFWESLSLLQKFLYCIAIPSTLVLILQTILLFLGWDGDGTGVNPSDTSGLDLDTTDFDAGEPADADLPLDGSTPGDLGSLKLFTLQGIIAFLCVFGWSGIVFSRTSMPAILGLMLATVLGLLFMFLVAFLIRSMAKLADDGSISARSALGHGGSVYLTIPARGGGHGKVNITIGSQLHEFDAITDSSVPLPTGSRIRVVDIRGDQLLVESD